MLKRFGIFSAAIVAALALAQTPAKAAERFQTNHEERGRQRIVEPQHRVIVQEPRFERNRVEYRIPEARFLPVRRIVERNRFEDCR